MVATAAKSNSENRGSLLISTGISQHGFSQLGIGVGLRPSYLERFLKTPPKTVSWVEVVTENFLPWQLGARPRSQQILERVRRDYPVAMHGVSLSIGSAEELNWDYLRRLKALAAAVEPAWISDHLCWTGIDGENLHDLLPLPYTQEALDVVVDRLRKIQDFLGRRILVENVSSYIAFEYSEMSEWDFLVEVCEQADCGILLDINNVYVSGVNHGFDPREYLDALPAQRIGQIHLAGHTKRADGLIIDTHDAPVSEEVWALYEKSVERFGPVTAMIERDGNFPQWSELEAELDQMRAVVSRVKQRDLAGNGASSFASMGRVQESL